MTQGNPHEERSGNLGLGQQRVVINGVDPPSQFQGTTTTRSPRKPNQRILQVECHRKASQTMNSFLPLRAGRWAAGRAE